MEERRGKIEGGAKLRGKGRGPMEWIIERKKGKELNAYRASGEPSK